MRPARPNRCAGFSLLEVLVAITLLSLIGVLAGGAVQFGHAAWERTEVRGSGLIETQVVQRYLRRQFGQMRSIRLRDGSRQPPVLFTGQPDQIRFAAPIAATSAPSGDHLIVVQTSQDRDAPRNLNIRFQRIGNRLPALRTNSLLEPLLQGVVTVQFRYFGVDPETGMQGWRDTWTSRAALPRMVEVQVTFADPTRAWPRFIVALPQGASTGGAG